MIRSLYWFFSPLILSCQMYGKWNRESLLPSATALPDCRNGHRHHQKQGELMCEPAALLFKNKETFKTWVFEEVCASKGYQFRRTMITGSTLNIPTVMYAYLPDHHEEDRQEGVCSTSESIWEGSPLRRPKDVFLQPPNPITM